MDSTFTGLSAFPLTPITDDAVDERAFVGLIERLATAGVDSITALGSTGSYAYLTAAERARVARLAVEHAGGTPVFVGVGALRTSQVLTHVESAEAAGAAGVLLAPITYQPLTEDDVLGPFRTVTECTKLPVIVYDNPGTTRFTFTTELYARIAELPGIASLKIPGVPADPTRARAQVAEIRAAVPEHVTIGVSGDAMAATGLNAGAATPGTPSSAGPSPALPSRSAGPRGKGVPRTRWPGPSAASSAAWIGISVITSPVSSLRPSRSWPREPDTMTAPQRNGPPRHRFLRRRRHALVR